jgi:hypothetical protein
MKNIIAYASGTILLAFGLLTLFLSSSVIFDLFGVREMEGNYVPFIVWANFIASLIYLFATYGFFSKKKWTGKILGLASGILILAFIFFILHINNGGIYEQKTVGAMIFRISLTLFFTFVAHFTFKKKN